MRFRTIAVMFVALLVAGCWDYRPKEMQIRGKIDSLETAAGSKYSRLYLHDGRKLLISNGIPGRLVLDREMQLWLTEACHTLGSRPGQCWEVDSTAVVSASRHESTGMSGAIQNH